MNITGVFAKKSVFLLLLVLILVGAAAFWANLFLTPPEEGQPTEFVVKKQVKIMAPDKEAPSAAAAPEAEPVRELEVAKAKPVAKKGEEASPPAVKEPPAEKKTAAKAITYKPWAVHMASFTSRNAALSARDRLVKAGLNAYVTRFEKEGVTWHRLRVGFYSTREEAEADAGTLSEKFNMPGAWVVKPDRAEVTSHM